MRFMPFRDRLITVYICLTVHCYGVSGFAFESSAVEPNLVSVFTFQTSVGWQAGVMGVWGCSLGTFYGLNNLLMTRIVGLHRLTSIYSARNFLGALGFFTIGPCVGKLHLECFKIGLG